MTQSYFVALAFIREEGDIVPGDAVECPNAVEAALQADVLSHAAALPVFPYVLTSTAAVGMSQRCQTQTSRP